MVEQKAQIATDSLSGEDACTLFRLFGFTVDGEATRLYGGYSSSNFKVHGRRSMDAESKPYLLKVVYHEHSIEHIDYELYVMDHLKKFDFPTNYPHATESGKLMVEHDGRKAMLLDFIVGGVPGQEVLAADETKAPRLLGDLSAALAQLHQVEWPADKTLRDIRCGFPVCNTGDMLKGDDLLKLEADEKVGKHEFVVHCRKSLEWVRGLYMCDVPWGVIHGDPFLDNTLYEDGPVGSKECKLLGLIDWEDSCVGPYVLDLAVCASACCFNAANELIQERLLILLKGYLSRRSLSATERASFTDFMRVGALACAFYRFCEFNVRKPESDAQAKDSYKLHYERSLLLLDGGDFSRKIAAALDEADSEVKRPKL